MDAEAENILPAGGVLAGAFMDYFQEGLHVRPRQDRLRDLEDQISQEVQTLLKQGFDWTQILHLPNLVDFPAAAAIEFRELMTGIRLSYSPEDVRAEATVERTCGLRSHVGGHRCHRRGDRQAWICRTSNTS